MDVRATRRSSADPAEPLADVLVSGDDEAPERTSRTPGVVAGLALATLAAFVLPVSLSSTGSDGAAPVDLALPEDAVVLLRRDGPPVSDRVHGGVHVDVVNEGGTPVRLLAATLSPGQWHVAVVDDQDGAADPEDRGRLLRPGWYAQLVVHRSVPCRTGADHGETPTRLTLEVEVDGRTQSRSLDVSRAYGGGLRDVLRFPEQFCALVGGVAAPGTIGDLPTPFLQLWPGGTGVVASP